MFQAKLGRAHFEGGYGVRDNALVGSKRTLSLTQEAPRMRDLLAQAGVSVQVSSL